MTAANGKPIAGATLLLYINEAIEDRASTTENGTVILRTRSELDAGTYDFLVVFEGSTSKNLRLVYSGPT